MRKFLALVLGALLLLTACGGNPAGGSTWQEQYDLGVRYLSDGSYEEAVIAFEAAIRIDPKQPEAYLGLADAYLGQGDLSKALDALERGWDKTGDPAIQEKLDQLLPAQDTGTLASYTEYTYDEQGREIRRASFHGDGRPLGTIEIEYDSVSREKQTTLAEDGSVEGWTVFYWVRDYGIDWGTGSGSLIVEFDAGGQAILPVGDDCTVSGGELTQYRRTYVSGTEVWEFSGGSLARHTFTSADGQFSEDLYDGQGTLTAERVYFDGVLTFEDTLEHDDANHVVKCRKWDVYGDDYQIITQYDAQGRYVEQYNNGYHSTWTYDENGYESYAEYDQDGSLCYTQKEAPASAITIRTTTINPDGSTGSFWEDDIAGNRVADTNKYTCTRDEQGLPLEVYKNGTLKYSYSYQGSTFTVLEPDGDSETYSMDGVELASGYGDNQITLYLYDSEGKRIRSLDFWKE